MPTAGGPSSPTPTTTPTTAPGTTTATPATGVVGTLSVSVGGTFPGVAHFTPVANWIDDITLANSMFEPPEVSAVANAPAGPNTSVTFQSTLDLTSGASLAKNGKY